MSETVTNSAETKIPRVKKCALCNNENKNILVHHQFPKTPHYQALWKKACKIPESTDTTGWSLCALHFSPDSYRELGNRLKARAVPSIFSEAEKMKRMAESNAGILYRESEPTQNFSLSCNEETMVVLYTDDGLQRIENPFPKPIQLEIKQEPEEIIVLENESQNQLIQSIPVPSLVPIKNNVLQEQEVLNKIIQQRFRNIVPKPTITSTNQNISAVLSKPQATNADTIDKKEIFSLSDLLEESSEEVSDVEMSSEEDIDKLVPPVDKRKKKFLRYAGDIRVNDHMNRDRALKAIKVLQDSITKKTKDNKVLQRKLRRAMQKIETLQKTIDEFKDKKKNIKVWSEMPDADWW